MILILLAHGFGRPMMAKLLHADGYLTSDSIYTLKTYMDRLYKTLRARNMADAIRLAYYWRFLPRCGDRCAGCKALEREENTKGS